MSSKINLQLATRLPLLLYRFCFVSPVIRLPNGTYTCSSWMVAYYVIATIAYLLYILFRYPTHRAFIPTIVQHFGHIWVALLLVDIFLSKATFILIVSMALYYAHHQMEFFNTVREIDICLHRHFAHVPLRYDRMFVLYICIVLVIWMICGTGAWFKWMHLQAMQRIGTTIPGDFVMITFVVEKLNLWMLTCAFVGCAIVVRERMCVLVTAMRLERVRPGAEQPQEPALEFGNVVELHRRLCRLVELMSIYAGGIMLLRFVHDFVLVTAYTYFLCDMLLHHDVSVLAGLPSVWNLLQNFARPVMVCVSAELVQEAAHDCRREIFAIDVQTPTDRDIMNSFQYWSLHNPVFYSAAQFANINMALFFASIGAIFTYLFILFQFNQRETEFGEHTNNTIDYYRWQ